MFCFFLGYRYSPLVEDPVEVSVEDPVDDPVEPVEASVELPVELVGETKERIWCEFMP
jgi:hypothetical protein